MVPKINKDNRIAVIVGGGRSPDLVIIKVIEEGQDWPARAREVRLKKFGRSEPENYAAKAKQARFLMYRGFTGAQIRTAMGTDIDLDEAEG